MRSIVFTSEDGYFLWITAVLRVYNWVHRDPHACATRYLISWHGISKHQNTAEFRRNCRAEYGIITWRTIYSNCVCVCVQFWPSGIVVACVCVCVCVCVCLSVCLSVCQSLACPGDNSGPVQARIAKFGPKMQKTLVKVPIVFGGNWPWPSRSNLTSKSEFTQFWACPDHNSLPIQARITKFGPEVENSLVKVPIVLGGNWPRPSRSNLI